MTRPALTRSVRQPATPEEVSALRAMLKRAHGNASAVAPRLGVSVRTLQRWLAALPELASECASWREAAGVTGPR